MAQLSSYGRAKSFSCAYRPYERQGTGGSINAVHGDVVRHGIRYIGKLSGRMDGYRGWRLPGSYRSYARQSPGGDAESSFGLLVSVSVALGF